MEVSKIEGSRAKIRREIERTHGFFGVVHSAAVRLIYEAGDYPRALKVLELASAFCNYRYTVLRAHILFGLGQEKKAESLWRAHMHDVEKRGNSSEIWYYRKEIRASRQEVIDRRNGKPHRLPADVDF